MLALAFLNPLLLVALPLCAIPIVIHLLNRRRFQQVPWAAMEYLLAAMKRNRKRLRMEQWLVLLLRTLAVLLLVALVSRPQLSGGALLGARTHHVVVLDDSASMTQRSGSARLFERAQDRVRALVDDLAQRRSGDLLSIVRTSRPLQPDLWGQRVGPDLGRRTGALLKELTVGDGAPDLGQVLQATMRRAGETKDASRTEYYVVSDRRVRDWVTDDEKPRPAVLAALSAMGEKEHLTAIGVGGQTPNLAVVDVRLVDRLAVAAVPTTLSVLVQNFGLDPTAPTSVAVEVDGKSRVVQAVPTLLPGERVAIPIEHTFHQAGFHRIEAALDATETYPLDDRRTLALDVRDKSRVLLVDGQPDEDQGETFYLQAAMDLAETGIEPQIVTDLTLEETDLAPFDFVWLCNVQAPSPATAQRLEHFVAEAGGPGVALGNQAAARRSAGLPPREGRGPLPLPIGEVAGDPDRPEPATLVAKDHPLCDRVGEIMDLLVGNVMLVKRWLSLDEPAGHEAKVVARIRDAEGPPLLVTRTFGAGGEVVLLAVTADRFWSNLPSTDLFVVLVNQIHRFGARRRDLGDQNLLADGAWRLELDPGTHRPDVTVRAVAEGGEERTFTAVEPPPPTPPTPTTTDPNEQPPPRLTLTVAMPELRQLGAYEVALTRHDGVPDTRVFARNPSIEESRLLGLTEAAFARLYPTEVQQRVAFVDGDTGFGAGSGEGELWHLLAVALLLGLLTESFLAWRFGRR